MTSLEDIIKNLDENKAREVIINFFSSEPKIAFRESKRILCIQPHADDTDVAAGGTIAKLAKEGKEIIYVTMTDDRLGTFNPELWPEKLAKIRYLEQKEAAKILGVKKLIWLNYRDSELLPNLEIRNRLIHIIRRLRPDIIMTVDPWLTYEAHPDHRYTGILACEAALFSAFPHACPEDLREGIKPHSVRFIAFYWSRKPNVYIDITDYMDIKLRAIQAHKSQFSDNWETFEQILRAYSCFLGKRIGVKYAEAFKIVKPSHLHCNVFTEDL